MRTVPLSYSRSASVSESNFDSWAGLIGRVSRPDGTRLAERTVAVTGSGRWQATLRLPAADRLTVALFRARDTVAYRTLYLAAEE